MFPSFSHKTFAPFLFLASVFIGISTSFAQVEKSPVECDSAFKGHKKPTQKEVERVLKQHSQWVGSSIDEMREAERANFCKADLVEVNLSEANLRGADLSEADLWKTNLSEGNLREANLSRADLWNANLSKANLWDANLSEANLRGADLSEADLEGADLSKADLGGADLSNANLENADLSKADLVKVNLSEANLRGANLMEADISDVDLSGVKFDLKPGGIPLIPSFVKAKNLEKLFYVNPPQTLIEIRQGFKMSGMREQERILTYVIKHGEMKMAWKQGEFWGKLESLFSWVFFEITCEWGKTPGRPLRILGFLILIFTMPYSFIIRRKYLFKRPAIWRSWLKDHVGTFENSAVVGNHFFFPNTRRRIRQNTWKSRYFRFVRRWFEAIAVLFGGFYFSLLSAFHFGWKDLNVGTWISRIQPRQYYLWSSGWVRSLSAVQSIISVYLLALWALTYFGRPFE